MPGPDLVSGREVSGTDKTLEECFEDGSIPKLDRPVQYTQWLKWRKLRGKRPTKATGEVMTSPKEESALWRSSMVYLFGEDWRDILDDYEAAGVEGEGAGDDEPAGANELDGRSDASVEVNDQSLLALYREPWAQDQETGEQYLSRTMRIGTTLLERGFVLSSEPSFHGALYKILESVKDVDDKKQNLESRFLRMLTCDEQLVFHELEAMKTILSAMGVNLSEG